MVWQGRFDGDDTLQCRIFQKVYLSNDYENISPEDFVIHGFAVDEGVKRNKGRMGAKDAPDVIRKNMSNFPVVKSKFSLLDFGNIYCSDGNLEKSQNELAEKISKVIEKQAKSIVLGGGHELTFPHYCGIKKALSEKKIGIINIDAHFDNRESENRLATSGTGFWQIAQQGEINSLHIGIQRNSNTLKLFDTANKYGMNYILAEELFYENLSCIHQKIDKLFIDIDFLYLTICMDVFNVAISPGVSAPAYNGIFADAAFMNYFRYILKSKKLIAIDIAEVNPIYDKDEKTARLAASLINEWFMV
jgi:formiminoglutamase